MKDPNFPSSSESWRIELNRVKELISGSSDPLEIQLLNNLHQWMKDFLRQISDSQEFRVASDGKRDGTALGIIRAIYLNKNPKLIDGIDELPWTTSEEKDLWKKIRSSDPLPEPCKERILKAVYEFDRAFLKSLISAMDLCEFGARVDNPNLMAIVLCHLIYKHTHKRNPTNRQLIDLLGAYYPSTQMDSRTLSDICKRHKLSLAAGIRGAPRKNSEVKKKRLPS